MGGSRPNKKGLANNANLDTNNQKLNATLKSLGLYAADTIGDGNCLFRALSDQYYGSPSKHLELRAEICDFISENKDEYSPFIDNEKGIDHHLANMRQTGTYGGHVELTAFARLKRRNIKVVQPGWVYSIKYKQSDEDEESDSAPISPKRRKADSLSIFPVTEGPIYVAYHDWEHYSSIRNIKGPHHGLPKIREMQDEDDENIPQPSPNKAAISKHKLKAMRGKVPTKSLLKATVNSSAAAQSQRAKSPSQDTTSVQSTLVESRDSSPLTASSGGSGSSAPSSLAPVTPPDPRDSAGRSGLEPRIRSRLGVSRESVTSRSPKRSFGEFDAQYANGDDGSINGRRVRRKPPSDMSQVSSLSAASNALPPSSSPDEAVADSDLEDNDDDEDKSVMKLLDTDVFSDSSLSPPPPDSLSHGKQKPLRMSQYLMPSSQVSDATAPPSSVPPSARPSPGPYEDESQQSTTTTAHASKLTRRQRKALGLPKHGNTSGKVNVIVIPGGRHPSRLAMKAHREKERMSNPSKDEDEEVQEWEKNGSGRKDARGFVVLNI
ncbi:cysteine proteinase [Serendipita vermifera]|nr:cysteine proteinase [Serendipita vermifera]